MGRGLLTSKRKALITSLVFILLFTLFQSWSYYNIAEKSYTKHLLKTSDVILAASKLPMFKASAILDSEPIGNPKNSPLNNIFMSYETSNQFWLKVEENVNMNHSKEFEYTSREIHPMFKHMYVPNKDGMFKCFQTGDEIFHSKVNDDYCDCADGSDEPSTSACSNGRFYCKYQSSMKDLMWVSSSRLNDGVCDCPDGSDETKPFKIPSLEFEGRELGSCQDKTEKMRRKETEFDEIRADGLKIKKEWISEVAGNETILKNKLYGSEGEFYKIKTTSCCIVKKSKYTYKICPFGESVQESLTDRVVIGRTPKWLKYDPKLPLFRKKGSSPENYILESNEGDSKNCSRHPRRTIIVFLCDVDNRVLDITETQLCVYEVHFATPAAC